MLGDRVGDLLAETLLHLRTRRKNFHHAHQRTQTNDLLTGQICNVRMPREGKQMMLAHRSEANVAHHHGARRQRFRRRSSRDADSASKGCRSILAHTGEELSVQIRHACGSLLESRAIGVFTDRLEQFAGQPLDTLSVDGHDQAVAGRACPDAGVPPVTAWDAVASAAPSTDAAASTGTTRVGTAIGGTSDTGRSLLESHSGRSGSLRMSVKISAIRLWSRVSSSSRARARRSKMSRLSL